MVVPVKLYHTDQPEKQLITYAVLDPQSDACFAKASVVETLGVVGDDTRLEISTMAGKTNVKTSAVMGLVMQSLETGSTIDLPRTFTRDDILIDRKLIPRKTSVQSWNHLKSVASDLPDYYQDADIGLLIGLNCGKALKPKRIVAGADTEPWAILTELGWSVVGMMNIGKTDGATCCAVSTDHEAPTICHFAFRTRVKEITPAEVTRLFDLDFKEFSADTKRSQEDSRFLQMMQDDMKQREDGHFVAPLPLKDPHATFQNNKSMAFRRLSSLKKRMLAHPQFRQDYQNFMAEMLEKGYAEKIPQDELIGKTGKVWYVAHHGVYSEKKENIRVVFDCSGQFNGQCLNSELMQGPDISNNMAGILIRFRKGPVAVTCDIRGMFNQVMVAPEDRDLLRFLWWDDGNVLQEPSEFRMTTHLFGATSSPACAMSALNKTADTYEDTCGAEAANFIRKDFYVDDGLTSTSNPATAVQLAKDTIKMCENGGFHLHKFTSNCPEVIAGIPADRRAKSLEHVDIKDLCVVEQALGIRWNLKNDCFLINASLRDKPMTRRGILSMISSVYDPLGWLSPFTLVGKNILKQLCCDGLHWDDPLTDNMERIWLKWRSDLASIADLTIPRCYSPPEFTSAACRWELHHFSDACYDGYGECTYLRIITDDRRVSTALVMSKSRVTPKRPMTIPRLELAAALTAVQASEFLRNELQVPNLKEFFWTDSKAVLGYIKNETKRFHVFVANRVQQIRQSTSVEQWRYVPSEENPADLASRGSSLGSLANSRLWWNGPTFLSYPGNLPEDAADIEVSPEDPEVKVTSFQSGSKDVVELCKSSLTERLKYFSSWIRARNAVAICLRYKHLLLERARGSTRRHLDVNDRSHERASFEPVTNEERFAAERAILKDAQESLNENALKPLNPFTGKDRLTRVGGRLRNSCLPTEVIHPVILPTESHVSKLIIDHVHTKLNHPGRETTLSELRHMGYWILKGRSAVSKCIIGCVKCRRLRGTRRGQQMAELPLERTEEAEPFTYCGVDAFGPFFVRERRSEVKRWGLLFTCLSSRAVHLEVMNSMTADSFINAYRRFICRRGPIRRIYCDNGTNFIGGKRLLENALQEDENAKIKRRLAQDDCDWVDFRFNIPYASHMGGVWERQIRSAKSALSSLLDSNSQQLDDELLQTFFVETEAIVNSRPLSYCSMTDSDTVEPITPHQLLTLKSKVVLSSPGRFCRGDMYGRRRWRRVQHLANEFWTRWRAEFLPSLQERRKWTAKQPNFEVGDIVLVVEDDMPRSKWQLARVEGTYPCRDKLVRKVRIRIGDSSYDRPVHRLIALGTRAGSRSDDLSASSVNK